MAFHGAVDLRWLLVALCCFTCFCMDVVPFKPDKRSMNCTKLSVPSPMKLLYLSHEFPWVWHKGKTALVSIQGNTIVNTTMPYRGWQLQVINATTIGTLATLADTADDADHQHSFMFYHLDTGSIQHVYLKGATHEAHHNRDTYTIFFLQVAHRRLKCDCPPLNRTAKWALETFVQVDLQGNVVWQMDVEELLCYQPLVRARRDLKGTDPFHMNGILYIHATDTVIVTSKLQSAVYAISRGNRTLQWAVGPRGTVPLLLKNKPYNLSGIHHCMPLGHRRFMIFHNNDPTERNPHNDSEALVIRFQANMQSAHIEQVQRGRLRNYGGAVVSARNHYLGGVFDNPPYQDMSLAWPARGLDVQCRLQSSMVYGARLIFPDFDLICKHDTLYFNAAHWDTSTVDGTLTVCYVPGQCRTTVVSLPPFLQRNFLALHSALTYRIWVHLVSADGFAFERHFAECD